MTMAEDGHHYYYCYSLFSTPEFGENGDGQPETPEEFSAATASGRDGLWLCRTTRLTRLTRLSRVHPGNPAIRGGGARSGPGFSTAGQP